MNNKYLIGGVALALVLSLVALFVHSSQPGNSPVSFGSTVGPEESNTYHCYAGGCQFFPRTLITATSSILCSFKNTSGATSTLLSFRAAITDTATTGIGITAQGFDLSTSSSAFGTSTPSLMRSSVSTIPTAAAGTVKTVSWAPGIASTTNTNVLGYDKWATTGESPYQIAPGEFLNLRLATGTPGTFGTYYTGACSATFIAP